MNDVSSSTSPPRKYWPLGQLVLARVREFIREPEAVFWVYGFPILMTIALGIAFRNKPAELVRVAIAEGSGASTALKTLEKHERFKAEVHDLADCRKLLRTGKVDLVVIPDSEDQRGNKYLFTPGRPESQLARDEVAGLLEQAGWREAVESRSDPIDEPGGRYIDFLIPGLLGMGLMGGGLWGMGFVTVDMRIRKLLKRFLATPMRKSDFLAGLLISRLLFMVPEVLILLVFAYLAFGVTVAGSIGAVVVLILLGSLSFAGLGLLVACRARTMEAVSGLMNLIMLPMWIFSGVFFNADKFPDFMQWFIQALPLTALNNALRAVMLDGLSLASQWPEVLLLTAWGVVSFVLALRWFRWN